ncbi:rhodanese-like domain-containing protein [Rubrivirga sp. S365]|uniref:Rhodanese-like domain-containing protein n=1 Tax=Rubrivirga litoralis TaxID=3075598 RepID=A0ABU3BNB7_9BACT|nr:MULTISPECIES: rhodanese-like domain-containing protein [unclassified Rubrivirga]MDT0630774.1 rhodanese-like domain-containing protein [Rubrivirga sp. F394]MDT7856444.1 rhodanese-like domain-containing protein [Rubrivirga sp. S365]
MLRLAAVAFLVVALVVAFRWFTGGGGRAEPAEVAAAARAGATFLDVRRPDEYAGGRVRGAQNVDVLAPGFRDRVAGLDRDQTVYVYCASGTRSGRAARILEDLGFARVVNAGGVSALARAGVPME